MRRTPPVVVHVQPQPAVQVVVALAGVGLACWAISHEAWAWPALLAVPALAAYAWREAAALPRRLCWDGEAWWLTGLDRQEETAVRLAVLIDLDAWLLLRVHPGPCWLPLSRRQQPQWGALRATLFAAPGGAVQR
ncbi:MAG TPA: hypothetical protein VIP05_27275 [Burkholderiaceae bacterium]